MSSFQLMVNHQAALTKDLKKSFLRIMQSDHSVSEGSSVELVELREKNWIISEKMIEATIELQEVRSQNEDLE